MVTQIEQYYMDHKYSSIRDIAGRIVRHRKAEVMDGFHIICEHWESRDGGMSCKEKQTHLWFYGDCQWCQH